MSRLTEPGAIRARLSAVRRFCATPALVARSCARNRRSRLRSRQGGRPQALALGSARAPADRVRPKPGARISRRPRTARSRSRSFRPNSSARRSIITTWRATTSPTSLTSTPAISRAVSRSSPSARCRSCSATRARAPRRSIPGIANMRPTEMKDTHFCFAFIHDPGALHSRKKIVLPQDLRGAKVRPAQSTIAELVTRLGGTNVQASAPEAREVLERGVADAITFPWGSLYLFGIDKVVKHHIDAPLYTTVFTFSMNKDKYEFDEPCAEEGHGRSLLDRLGGEDRRPLGRLRSRRPRQDESRSRLTSSSSSRPIRWQAWRATVEPLEGKLGGGGEAGRRRSRRRARRAQRQHRQIRRRSMTAAEGRRAGVTGNAMDRFIDGIELAAAAFIGIVAIDIFVSVLLRYLFNASIPDSYDFGRLLLGILIFWGIAATSYRGGHITVDLVWAAAGPRGKRVDRYFRDAGALVRRHRSDRDAVRQGALDPRRPCSDLRSSSADLAVLRRRLGGRRVGRDPHRRAHLAAHFSPREAQFRTDRQGRGMRRRR